MHAHHGFVDESARGPDYYLCAVITRATDVRAVRRTAQSFRKPGQNTVHFSKERNSRRNEIVNGFLRSGLVRARLYFGKGNETVVRSRAMRQLAHDLVALRTDRLIIESRSGRDHRDRQVLSDILRATGSDLAYQHCTAPADAGLWVADAFAWCYSAGGRWRSNLTPVLDCEYDVGEW